VFTGLSGLRQVLARVRYDLCRGPAPLRREPVGLCAPVPRDDAEAGRRSHRRPVAGDLDRAEDHQPQPALDRRHGHRDLRLPAPAVRPRRCPYSPATGLPIESQTVSQMVDRALALPDEGTRGSTCWRRSCAGARASSARNWPSCRSGLPARQGQRHLLRDPRRADARQEIQARHRCRRGPHRRARRQRRTRLADSLETALELADGMAIARIRRQAARRGDDQGRQQVKNDTHERMSSRRASPARSPASRSRRSNRACSRSTRRRAPARPATASAPS
jgi:hypothetical protein